MLYAFGVVNDDQDITAIKFDTADKGRIFELNGKDVVPLEITVKQRKKEGQVTLHHG